MKICRSGISWLPRLSVQRSTYHSRHKPMQKSESSSLKLLSIALSEDQSSHDRWTYVWGSAEFTAHKYYTFCFRDVHAHQAFKWIWKSKSTMKIKVFGWLLLSDRLNTRNMLKQRHYNIGYDHGCILCGSQIEETVEHLFFECQFSLLCWSSL